MKYRKKAVVIEAVQYNGDNEDEIIEFTGGIAKSMRIPFSPSAPDRERFPETMTIPTLEGDHRASKGDWIIKGIKGEFYPCKPDIFEATYEKVVEEPTVGSNGIEVQADENLDQVVVQGEINLRDPL